MENARTRVRRWRGAASTLAGLALAAACLAPGTQAAFPGANGKIAFASGHDDNNEIYVVMNAGGSALALEDVSARE